MRVPLEEIVLQIHHLHLSEKAEDFLANVLQPPAKKSVIGAVQTLISVGALTNEEQLTPLGTRNHNNFILVFYHGRYTVTYFDMVQDIIWPGFPSMQGLERFLF